MTHERNGYTWFRKVGWVTGAITGIIILTGLVMGIILQIYIFPVIATKEALNNYITKEVFTLTLKNYEQRMKAIENNLTESNRMVKDIYGWLLTMKKEGKL